MKLNTTVENWMSELGHVLATVKCACSGLQVEMPQAVSVVKQLLQSVKEHNGTVWWIGNGGSVTIGSHLSQDLINKLKIKSSVLTDASLLTCFANDFGYENIYARPLEVLLGKNDLLIAISSSGNSANILKAATVALDKGARLITLSGFGSENKLRLLNASVDFYLPSSSYGIVETGHLALMHALIDIEVEALVECAI